MTDGDCEEYGYSMTVLGEDGMGTVSPIEHPPQNIPPSITKEGNSKEAQMGIPYRFHSKGLFVYENPNRHKKDIREQERDARDKARLTIEKRTFWVGVVGIVGLLFTLILTWKAVDVTVKSAHTDKRAWVGLGEIQVLNKPVTGKPLGMRVVVRNSGESPAVHTFAYGYLSLFKKAPGDDRIPFSEQSDFASCVRPKPQWDQVAGGAIVIPGADALSMNRLSKMLPEKYIAMVIEGKQTQVPLQDVDEIPTAPGTPPNTVPWQIDLYFFGCINYFDAFHEAHRTSFCYMYSYNRPLETILPNGTFIICPQGNDAD